jgi:hypothetical protein
MRAAAIAISRVFIVNLFIVDICGVTKVNGTFKKIVTQPFSFFPSTVLASQLKLCQSMQLFNMFKEADTFRQI